MHRYDHNEYTVYGLEYHALARDKDKSETIALLETDAMK